MLGMNTPYVEQEHCCQNLKSQPASQGPTVPFFWLIVNGAILTWDNFRKRGWQGLGICVLCSADEECIAHSFLRCLFCFSIWERLACVSEFFSSATSLLHENFLDLLEGYFFWKKRLDDSGYSVSYFFLKNLEGTQ